MNIMKKLSAIVITLVLLVSSFSVVSAAPWDNPNGFWLHDVFCGDKGTFDVWVPNDFTKASFNNFGEVGISKALYINFGNGYEQVWKIPGNGVFKNTTWCEWEYDGLPMAGEILIP
jgi:hypothetical protein